jgi:hypothetical protein
MKRLVSILTLTMLATSAYAQISYDYFEAGYKKVTFDTLEFSEDNVNARFKDLDGDGLIFEGSFSFGGNYFAYADFDFASIDLGSDLSSAIDSALDIDISADSVIDLSTQVLGVGYHTDGDRQFVAKVGFARGETDSEFLKLATLGYVIELGGRGLINDNFEWEANIDITDFDANDGPSAEIGANTALRYHFGNNFSTGLSASTTKDDVTYGLNFRFNFSR